jgi:hypothetical protein
MHRLFRGDLLILSVSVYFLTLCLVHTARSCATHFLRSARCFASASSCVVTVTDPVAASTSLGPWVPLLLLPSVCLSHVIHPSSFTLTARNILSLLRRAWPCGCPNLFPSAFFLREVSDVAPECVQSA